MTRPLIRSQPPGGKPRLMFYCQHAMGLGHLVRSIELVRGLDNFDVTFVNAGDVIKGFQLPPTVRVVNLQPLKVDDDFRLIRGDGDVPVSEAVKAARREYLGRVWQELRPDILMIELFPFGRKKFEFELIPLLREILHSEARTKVVCSLRDILVGRNDQLQWEERVCKLVNTYFDLILIHSDPAFQRLEETFGRVSDLCCEICYTGFVAPAQRCSRQDAAEPLRLPDDGKPLIVASIGGGRIGGELIYCAIEASVSIREKLPHHLAVVTGPRFPDEEWSRLRQWVDGMAEVTVLRFTGRFLDYLKQAALSISLAGYNTCMDILATGVPALVYPITAYNKDEQLIRAYKLEGLGAVSVIRPEDLTPATLGRKILSVLERKPARIATAALDTRGVENTARFLAELVGREVGPATMQTTN